jgi:hypothetical protein
MHAGTFSFGGRH